MAQKDIRQLVEELIELMNSNALIEIEVAEGDRKVKLKKQSEQRPMLVTPQPIPEIRRISQPEPVEVARAADVAEINSPMVGTFYAAPSPEADPYVMVGDDVVEDAVVCIIEAMKVMNEIKAEVNGQITEVLVANGEAVEFGQPMFEVKLSPPAA